MSKIEIEIVDFRFNASYPDFVLRCFGVGGDLVDCSQRDLHFCIGGKHGTGLPPLVEADGINLMLAWRNENRGWGVPGEIMRALGNDDPLACGRCELEKDVLVAPTVPRLKDRLCVLGRIGENDVKLFGAVG